MSKRELTLPGLTQQEAQIACDLAKIWQCFEALPNPHADDTHEFQHAINAAQRVVLARLGHRQLHEIAKVQASSIQNALPA